MSASYGNYLTEEDPNKKKPEGTTPSTTPTTATGGTTTPPLTYEGFVGTGTGSNAYQAGVGVINSNHDTAVEAATTNRDLGYEYAEGVKNSIYGMAAAQREEADKNTEIARQRGIIDSQSSYQKAVGAYGSNAETLAGRGLSGSGYGEYLTADAYATHRGQVQNINADALRANREAAYAEKQAQMAADSEYLKNLYGINTEYNNAISKAKSDLTTGMYQAALGLNEAQNAAYGKLFDSASKGVSIDAIMQDGTWGDLTTEQQNAITAEAERVAKEQSEAKVESDYNTALGLLADGWTLEEIKNHLGTDAVKALTDSGKFAQLENASNVMARIKSETEGKTASEALTSYVQLALDGMSIETIQKLAESLGHYGVLSAKNGDGTSLWDAVVAEAEKYTNQNATNDTLTDIDNVLESGGGLDELQNIEGFDAWTGAERDEAIRKASDNTIKSMVTKGASLDEIKNSEAWKTASTGYKDQVEAAYKEQAELDEGTANDIVTEFNGLPLENTISINDLNDFLDKYVGYDGKPLSNEMKNKVRTKWVDNNVKIVTDRIGKAKFRNGKLTFGADDITADDIIEDIDSGVFGDKASEVIDAYGKALVDNVVKVGKISDAIFAKLQLDALGDAAKPWVEKLGIKTSQYKEWDTLGYKNGITKYNIDGSTYKYVSSDIGALTEAMLDAAAPYDNTIFEFNGKIYARGGNKMWYQLERI